MTSIPSPTLVEDKCNLDSVTARKLSNSSSSTESPASTPQPDTTPEPPPPHEIENASSKTHQKHNPLKRLTRHVSSSSRQFTSFSSSFRPSLLKAPICRLRNSPISQPHNLWPRKPPPPGLPGSDHPLYSSIYCLSITQGTARCTLSYTTRATAVYIGSNLWLAPARCFRFEDEVLNIMDITAAHSSTGPIDYRDLAAGRVPGFQLVPAQYLDARNAPHKPIPYNSSIDWRLDLVLLTTRIPRATPPAASTAALPGRSPPGLQKATWVGINKHTVITPYIMARYPGEVTERLLRATVEGLRPGYISVAKGRAGYGSAQPECVKREVGCAADFVTYHINITDDSPGGAVGAGRGREVIGIHLACHKISPRIAERTYGEDDVETKEEPSIANVAINLARRYIVPEMHDAFLKRCWEEFVDNGPSGQLDEWKSPEWMQVPPVLSADRPGVWMEYVDKRIAA